MLVRRETQARQPRFDLLQVVELGDFEEVYADDIGRFVLASSSDVWIAHGISVSPDRLGENGPKVLLARTKSRFTLVFMQLQIFTCDVCGAQRGEKNHWFKALMFEANMFEGDSESTCGLIISVWGLRQVKASPVKETHLCGLPCVNTFLSRYFDKNRPKEE